MESRRKRRRCWIRHSYPRCGRCSSSCCCRHCCPSLFFSTFSPSTAASLHCLASVSPFGLSGVCVCACVVTLCCPLSVDVPGKTPARPPSLLLFPFLLSKRLTIDPTLCAWAWDLPSPLLLQSRKGLHVARRGVGLCVYASAHTPPFFLYIAAPPHAPMSSSKTQHTVKAESNVCASAFKAAMRWRWHPSPFRLAFTAAFTLEAPQRGEASGLPCISVSLACLS